MKKTNLSLQSALLLLGTAGLLTACSSEDVLGGGGSQSADAVKTQFAINIPAAGNKVSGRLSQEIVQGQNIPLFRGMQSVMLVPTIGDASQSGTLSTAQPLGDILSNELLTASNAKVYYNVELATGVDHILFYGEGKKGADATDKDNGVLVAPTDWTTTANIQFKLKPIAETGAGDNPVETILNTLVKTTGWSTSSDFKIFYTALQGLNAGSVASVKAALTLLKEGVKNKETTTETEFKNSLLTAIETALTSLKDETYPQNLGLPDGAVRIAWNSVTSEFEQINSDATIGNVILPNASDYVYPAALYYFVNSTLKTSETPQAENYGVNNWEAIKNLYTSGATTVTENTVSVLMETPVEYAVARLDVKPQFGANVTDNHKETVNVEAGEGMQLKGVLIGGQKNVNYDFTPISDDAVKTIYDGAFTPTKIQKSSVAATFYTLALQNTQAESVNFALELVNKTGSAFQGIDGLVPDGGTFYLVGTLTPQTEKADNHVFLQDYTTTANVTINSLAHAYNCIPDLENPSLELGLSVNLEWEEGLVDNVVIE